MSQELGHKTKPLQKVIDCTNFDVGLLRLAIVITKTVPKAGWDHVCNFDETWPIQSICGDKKLPQRNFRETAHELNYNLSNVLARI